MNKKLVLFLLVAVAGVWWTAGCETDANINAGANRNTAIVVNNNENANLNTASNRNANTGRKAANANITRKEYEADKGTWADEAKKLGRKIGTGVNDGWLWTKTRALLAAEDDLRDSTIDVDVENDVVTLTGTVANNEQKARAGRVAQGVEGVKTVKNNLTVSASGNANNANGNANRGANNANKR